MAGKKISQLPPIVAPALTDILPVVQSVTTYKETISQLFTLFGSNFFPLPVIDGGTGTTTSSGTGSVVLSISPTLVTPALGTPASGVLTNVTGYTVAHLADVAWTSYAGTITYSGFSGTPTTNTALWKQIGKTIFVNLDMTGTSNTTGFAFSLPIVGGTKGITYSVARAEDNGTYSSVVYGSVGSSGATTSGLVINDSGTGWTNSGTKSVRCSFFYETA